MIRTFALLLLTLTACPSQPADSDAPAPPPPVLPTPMLALSVMAPEHAERCAEHAADVEIRIVRGAEVEETCGVLRACYRHGRDPADDEIVVNVEEDIPRRLAHELSHWWRTRCMGESRGNLDHGTEIFEDFRIGVLVASGWVRASDVDARHSE